MARLGELARAVGGELRGPEDMEIAGVGSLEGAGPGEIAPVDSKPFLRAARRSRAGAFVVSQKLPADWDRPVVVSDFPLAAMNRMIELFGLVPPGPHPGVHPTAVVDPEARVHGSVSIGPYVVVGAGARVGARTVLHPHVVLEPEVVLGEDCIVEPGAVIQRGALLGNRVRIGSHAVISRQGFGFAPGPKGPVFLHHIGRVVLEDDVHVGAGAAIDRARFDETRVGRFSGLDNLVHVGHNGSIGERSFVAAQTGIAGNGRVGNDCEVGGQVGIANHSGVGDRCRVAAKTGVMKMFGDDTEVMWYPGLERRKALRMLGALKRLSKGS